MGRDLLQSHTEAMTKLRQEGRVTSCSVHPRCATGTVPAAAACATCSSPCLWGGNLAPVQHSLGFSSVAARPRSRRARASPWLAEQPPAPTAGSAQEVSAGDAQIYLPAETGDISKWGGQIGT